MNNLSAEIIVVLYTKYQMINYWLSVSHGLMIFCGMFTVGGLVGLGSFYVEDDELNTPLLIIDIILGIGFLSGLLLFAYNKYQIEVVLKPEIAKHIVPMGLDVADKVTSEISEMWDLLKGLLNK